LHQGVEGVFLGYPFVKKGWQVYDLETSVTFVSRDVIFCEDQFPFEQMEQRSSFGLDVLWQPNMVFSDEYGSNEEAFTSTQQRELENKGNHDTLPSPLRQSRGHGTRGSRDTLPSPLLQSREHGASGSRETGPIAVSNPAILN